MNKISNADLKIAALATAASAVPSGIKKTIFQRYKKSGFLMTVLLFALGLNGCYTIPLQNLQKQSSNVPVDKNAQKKPERIIKLGAINAWQKFKSLWKKLDNVSPKKENLSADNSGFYGEYTGAIEREEAETLNSELKESIENLRAIPDKSLISEKEINLLDELSRERINYMSWGLRSMVTRMAPSYFSANRDLSLKDLERKIDVLLALKASKTVSEKEFDSAMANIQKDIESYAVLNAIADNGYYPFSLYEHRNEINIQPVEKYVAILEQSYNEYIKSMEWKNTGQDMKNKEFTEQRYQKTREAVNETIKTLPPFKELIADLEN